MPNARPAVFVWCLLLCVLGGCDLSEPERFYNDVAYPPRAGSLTFDRLQAGQHVAGILRFRYVPTNVPFSISAVHITIDGEGVTSSSSAPWDFELDTSRWPEGEHVLTLNLYQDPPPHGLLNLLAAPSLSLSTTLVFDQTPPEPPRIQLEKVAGGRHARLSWEPSTANNFFSYIIYREARPRIDDSAIPIDTLYDPLVTVYTDTTMPPIFGYSWDYHVAASNGYTEASGNAMTFEYGQTLDFLGLLAHNDVPLRPIPGLDQDVLYLGGLLNLYALSTRDGTILRTLNWSNSTAETVGATIALSSDGSEIYALFPQSRTLSIIDAASFNRRHVITLPFALSDPEHSFTIRDNELVNGPQGYVIVKSFDDVIRLIDLTRQTVVDQIEPDGSTTYTALATSRDGGLLYAAANRREVHTAANRREMYAYRVTGNGFALLQHRQEMPYVHSIQVASDNKHVYTRAQYTFHTQVDILDPVSLDKTAEIVPRESPELVDTSGIADTMFDFYVTDAKVYVSHSVQQTEYDLEAQITVYDKSTLEAEATMLFFTRPLTLIAPSNDAVLYAFSSSGSNYVIPRE